MAKEIAEVLGAKVRRNGYFEGNDYCVTWTFGHLCSLQEPHEYTEKWKQWNLSELPMIPSSFRIKLIDDDGIKRQFAIIEELFNRAEMIINCGDAGQEGELIQRWVLTKAKCKAPVMRLWISSLTEEAIREGFANLMPSKDFDTLYAAGSAPGNRRLAVGNECYAGLHFAVTGMERMCCQSDGCRPRHWL